MDTLQQTQEEYLRAPISDVSIIRREFVELTGNLFSAVILNQLLYWTLRVKDFDYLLEEERRFQPDCNVLPRHGWIYKTAKELNEETMLGLSPPSIRKYLKILIDEGWIDERSHPTERWDHTTQYRVNLRQLQEDLLENGRSLPEVYLRAFGCTLPRCCFSKSSGSSHSRDNSLEDPEEIPNERNFASKEKDFASDERIFSPNEKSFASNTENTTENTNKEKLATRAQGDFSDGGVAVVDDSIPKEPASDVPVTDMSLVDQPPSDVSIAEEMLELWKQHVDQHIPSELIEVGKSPDFPLTPGRKDQLESVFAFHFKNDMRLWEQFCLRVKASRFMMGGGERKWYVRLEWLLKDDNLSKALSGKYDNSRSEYMDSREWKLEKIQSNPESIREKSEILASIKDPVWKKWCAQLAEGVRYNDFKMLHEPLSALELEQIANAWFVECEDKRLIWVASAAQAVLNKIESLRLRISWVFEKEYPDARAIRTRLLTKQPGERS
jgi:hypothetical protein